MQGVGKKLFAIPVLEPRDRVESDFHLIATEWLKKTRLKLETLFWRTNILKPGGARFQCDDGLFLTFFCPYLLLPPLGTWLDCERRRGGQERVAHKQHLRHIFIFACHPGPVRLPSSSLSSWCDSARLALAQCRWICIPFF